MLMGWTSVTLFKSIRRFAITKSLYILELSPLISHHYLKLQKMAKARKKAQSFPKDSFVPITNRFYGNALKGIKIHYEGEKPKFLNPDGSMAFGKDILELLKRTYTKFECTITKDTDEIKKTYGIERIRISQKTMQVLFNELRSRTKDTKTDILDDIFSIKFPGVFSSQPASVYAPGALSKILNPAILPRLSKEDKTALNTFLPGYIAAESYTSINILKATAEIKTLQGFADELRSELKNKKSENWWQDYIKKNILVIQQGYIKSIDKMNVSLGNTKYPDFALITHDSYLDVLEIKKPDTELMKLDDSRGNYYWDKEISKAISQAENYLHLINSNGNAIRSYILDNHKIDLKVVRPRGIILAGNASVYTEAKQKDDFRLLTQANKNLVFVTYDELLSRLENYIAVLQQHSANITTTSATKKATKKAAIPVPVAAPASTKKKSVKKASKKAAKKRGT